MAVLDNESGAADGARRAAQMRDGVAGKIAILPTRCSRCDLREICLPCSMAQHDTGQPEAATYSRRQLKRADSVYRAGDAFTSIYSVRSGFLKTVQRHEDGRTQVTGFHMSGELLGMDGIGPGVHTCSLVALEDSEVCVVSYTRLTDLSRLKQSLQNRFHKEMSREIVRNHGMMMLLGTCRAEERLAVFLLNLSQRLTARGYSPSEFVLRMTREDIGSYLGLTFETVSRMLSMFQGDGLINVQYRHIQILDIEALQRSVGRMGARCEP